MNQKLGIDPFWDDLDRIQSALPTVQSVSGVGGLTIHTHSGPAQGGPLVIGTTDSGGTAGSVLFAGVAGVLQQDNANFFWDDTNDLLGVGMNAPAAVVEINAATASDTALIIQTTDDNVANRLTEWQGSGAGVVAYVDVAGNADFEGHMAVGAIPAVSTTRLILARETYTDTSGTLFGVQSHLGLDPASASSAAAYAVEGRIDVLAAETFTGTISAFRAWAQVDTGVAATLNTIRGLTMLVDVEDATATTAYGGLFETPRVDTGLATQGYGIRISQGTVGAGSITTLYGLRVNAMTAGDTNWSIYTGAGDSRFGDAVHIVDYLYHDGDLDTFMSFTVDAIDFQAGGVQFLTITEDGVQDTLVINEGGADVDTRIESAVSTHMLFGEGSSGRVGVNTSVLDAQLDVDQSNAAGAIPGLKVDQGDASEPCVLVSGDGNDQDIVVLKIDVTGGADVAMGREQ